MSSPVPCKPTKHFNSLSYFSCGPFLAPSSVSFFSSTAAPGTSFTDQKHRCKNVLIRIMSFKDLLMPLWKKLCHYLFSQFCWQVLYCLCLFSLVACFQKKYSGLFSKFIQIFVIIEIGFCAPKACICYISVHSFRYLVSPKFGWRGKALSWEYQLDPVPCFSLQVDIALQAENRDWECCSLQEMFFVLLWCLRFQRRGPCFNEFYFPPLEPQLLQFTFNPLQMQTNRILQFHSEEAHKTPVLTQKDPCEKRWALGSLLALC